MPGHRAASGYELRITKRCLLADLGFREDDTDVEIADLAERGTQGADLLRTFLDKRGASPEAIDEDELSGLVEGTPRMYPLRRGGRQRGLTWYDESENQIVWLVAAHHAHRSGEPTDSYVYLRGLSRADLLPSREDMRVLRTERANQAADAIWDDVPRLMAEAGRQRNVEVRGHVGRVPIGMLMTDHAPPHLYLAVSKSWEVEGANPPEIWLFALLARCYNHAYEDEGSLPLDHSMPNREVTLDEEIYADFVTDWQDV